MKRVRELAEAELCPCCGKRPISVSATGLCWRCHYNALCAVHEEEAAKLQGQRELWAARSRLQRRRRATDKAGGDCSDGTGDGSETMDPCTP